MHWLCAAHSPSLRVVCLIEIVRERVSNMHPNYSPFKLILLDTMQTITEQLVDHCYFKTEPSGRRVKVDDYNDLTYINSGAYKLK